MAYRIGEVSAQTGLTPKQLRDWERRGVVRSNRGVVQQRLYDAAAIERLRHAKRMHDAGLSLADVKHALALLDGGALGLDDQALVRIRSIHAQMRKELEIADELIDALRQRLLRVKGMRP